MMFPRNTCYLETGNARAVGIEERCKDVNVDRPEPRSSSSVCWNIDPEVDGVLGRTSKHKGDSGKEM